MICIIHMAKTRKRKDHAKRIAARRLEIQHAEHRQRKMFEQQIEAMKSARLNELLGSQLPDGVSMTTTTPDEALSELEMLQVLDMVDPETVKPIDAIDVTADEKGV